MPTTYAHDLFGKEVYKRLPSDMKDAGRNEKREIGLRDLQ